MAKRSRKSAKKSDRESASEDDDLRGRSGQWSKTEERWIKKTFPGFDCKISPHNGEPQDDPDVKEYVTDQWLTFKAEFPNTIGNSIAEISKCELVSVLFNSMGVSI